MPDERETLRLRPEDLRAGALRLVVLGAQGAQTHALPSQGSLLLGRGDEADICIEEASISRKHARLLLGADRLQLEDLGSANGTRVRERKLEAGEIVEISPGDPLELGATLLILQRVASQAQAPARSGEMERLRALIPRIAASNISVVLLGETGVGKSVLAAEIHAKSPRAKGPFLALNCAAVPAALLESELFGHEKGAFSGAVQARAGLFEAASGGTLLLDEIGEMPLEMQPKLLQVLEERAVRRVGSTRAQPIDVRIISATNRDLEQGGFRSDLWFRLNGIALRVPPLRERTDEIEPLARAYAQEVAKAPVQFTPEAIAALRAREWPGNLRELRNAIERALLLASGGPLRPEDFAASSEAAVSGPSLAAAPGGDEKERIIDALEQCGGNQGRAADLLGISRRTLVSRLDKYGLPRPRKR